MPMQNIFSLFFQVYLISISLARHRLASTVDKPTLEDLCLSEILLQILKVRLRRILSVIFLAKNITAQILKWSNEKYDNKTTPYYHLLRKLSE